MKIALTFVLALVLCAPAHADRPGPKHNFPIVREGTEGLADHTVFRPSDPAAAHFKLPVVVWGNGGCRNSNEEFRFFLTHFAPYGYFIVANGDPAHPYNPDELLGLTDPQPEKLVAGLDWALAQNDDPASPWHDRLDPSRIAFMGQSCGGGEAIDASADPRVRSTIGWNEGLQTNVAGLHAPLLIVSGGVSDYAAPFQQATWATSAVPTVLATHADAGHTGLWDDPSDGAEPPGPLQEEPLLVAQRWLELTLYGQPAGQDFFLGAGCELCTRSPWTVESKHWDRFAAEPSEAPPACSPRARETVRLRVPRGFSVERARVRIGASRSSARFVQEGRRVRVRVALGDRSGRVVVRVTLRGDDGSRVRARRAFGRAACG